MCENVCNSVQSTSIFSASLVDEIKTQDRAKKESEKEILKDLDSVKEKADEVLQKLGKML